MFVFLSIFYGTDSENEFGSKDRGTCAAYHQGLVKFKAAKKSKATAKRKKKLVNKEMAQSMTTARKTLKVLPAEEEHYYRRHAVS